MSTVALSLVREHTVSVKPPRTVFVPFPFGLPFGQPGDAKTQRAILDLAFATLDEPAGPVLVDYRTAGNVEPGSPLQASEVAVDDAARTLDLATEVTLMRRYWEQRLESVGRTAVGLTRVPPARFRGIVRFLEHVLTDAHADTPDRPADMDVPTFIRSAVDDLRVLYIEARMQTHPHESSVDRQRWLLGSTALGIFLRTLKERLEASEDPALKAVAFGIAR